MARPRTQSDAAIFTQLLAVLQAQGEKSLTFGVIGPLTGLAPATLAQRYGSVEGMVRTAALAEWAGLTEAVTTIEAEALVSAKGAQALLKQLPTPAPALIALSLRDEALRQAAESWRIAVEAAISARRGGGSKGREAAALIFATWQGRQLWQAAGGKSFRLADMLKALP